MQKVLIAGAGKIGALIACFLLETDDFEVTVADISFEGEDIKRVLAAMPALKTAEISVADKTAFLQFLDKNSQDAVISCLPYFLNIGVAECAKQKGMHYFDLTEDTQVTDAIKALAKTANNAFVSQCGLAPGFISIVANDLMQHFESLDTVKLRVGALPQHTSNALHYALTWSTDGLINEYGNTCFAIEAGEGVTLQPLEGLEALQVDGLSYEAFNTSGGLGSLADSYTGQVQTLNYKTIRYPGHCEKMRVLMNDLRLNDDRDTLKRILETALPKTYQDVIVIYVSVRGRQGQDFIEESYVKKVYPQEIAGLQWSAIQVTTAAGICAVADMVLAEPSKYQGMVLQEQFALQDFLENRFGRYYA